jgi:hypothetical protein
MLFNGKKATARECSGVGISKDGYKVKAGIALYREMKSSKMYV